MGRNYDSVDDFGQQAKEKIESGLRGVGQKASDVGSSAISKGSREVIKGFRSAKNVASDSIQKAIASGQAPASMGTLSGASGVGATTGAAAGTGATTGASLGAGATAAGTGAAAGAGASAGAAAGAGAAGTAGGTTATAVGTATAAEASNPVGWVLLIIEAVILILVALYLVYCVTSLAIGEDGQNLAYLDWDNKGFAEDFDTPGSYLTDKENLSSGNLATLSYYELLSNKTVLQEGVDDEGNKTYISYDDPNAKHDKFERDKDLAIDYNILYAFNQKVFGNEYVFPEAILKPVAHDKDYNLCAIKDENGNLNTLFSLEFSNMTYKEMKERKEDENYVDVDENASAGATTEQASKKEEKNAEKELRDTQKNDSDTIKIKDEDLVLVKDYIPDIYISLVYATTDNFVEQQVYPSDFGCYLRYGTVLKLKAAHEAAKANGYGGLMIWDAYRPQSAVDTLYNAYPDKNYVAPKSNHTKGNTVDLTIVDTNGKPIEMPSDFDTFDATADTDYSDCTETQKAHSEYLTTIMVDAGFNGYDKEWWHFSDSTDYAYQDELQTKIDENETSESNTSATVSDKGTETTASKNLSDVGISTLCSYKEATTSSYLKGTYTSKIMVNPETQEEKVVPLDEAISYNIPLGTETFYVLDKTVSMWESCKYNYNDIESCVAQVTEGRSDNPSDNVSQVRQADETVKEKVKKKIKVYPVRTKDGKLQKEFETKQEAEEYIAKNTAKEYKLGTEYEKEVEVEEEVTYQVYYLRSETSGMYQTSCTPAATEKKVYDNTYLYQYLESGQAKCPMVSRDYSVFQKFSSYAGVGVFSDALSNLFDGNGNSKQSNSQKAFIEWVAPIAIEEAHHTGIYPSLIIAQCIEEGGWGTSGLAKNYFNHVGIKGYPKNEGTSIEFWDDTTYTYKTCVMSGSHWMDFSGAGGKDDGLKACIRYYGRNFWITSCYGENGVLNHKSAGLSVEAAKKDALKQLSEYAPMYCEGNEYYDKIVSHCDKYNLWQYDEIFLKEGGWDGTVPYKSNSSVNSSNSNVTSGATGSLNEADSKAFSMFYHAMDSDVLGSIKGLKYETVKFGLGEEDVDEILRTANRFTFGLSREEESLEWTHDDLLNMSLLIKDRNHGLNSGDATTTGDWVFYLQYEGDWATKNYGPASYASSGCGPTSLAMVIASLVDPSITPDKVGALLVSRGYRIAGAGTAEGFVTGVQNDFGYYAEQYSCSEEGIKEKVDECLRTGGAVVWSSGSQPFTSQGHFMAMRGITADGKWLLADPNDNATKKHNEKEWDPGYIMARWHNCVYLVWKEKP